MEGIVGRTCTKSCDRISFFDRKRAVESLTGLTLLSEWLPNSIENEDKFIENAQPYLASMDKFDCRNCRLSFKDSNEMKAHFKSSLHINTISLTKKYADIGDSTFGLNCDNETDCSDSSLAQKSSSLQNLSPDTAITHCKDALGQPMIFFRNKNSEIIGIFRCLLYTKSNMPSTVDDMLHRVVHLRQSRNWAFLLYSGGKFSGGIFDGDKELIHKTMHRYTVRAKQGGSQTARDSASGGMGTQKSAGSSLRRYGEQAIRSDISKLLHVKWRPYLQACQLILVWSPKVHKGIFFIPPDDPFSISRDQIDDEGDLFPSSGPLPDADPSAADAVAARMGVVSNDCRLRRLPCRAKNITYAHVRELQKEFSSFRVFDTFADPVLISQCERKQLETLKQQEGNTLLETRSGRLFLSPQKQASAHEPTPLLSTDEESGSSSSENPPHDNHSSHLLVDPTSGNSASVSLSQKTDLSIVDSVSELCAAYSTWHHSVKMSTAVGNRERLVYLLQLVNSDSSTSVNLEYKSVPTVNPISQKNSFAEMRKKMESSRNATITSMKIESPLVDEQMPLPSPEDALRLVNQRLSDGRNLLHLAVELHNDPELVQILLSAGCRPDCLDSNDLTPYRLSRQLDKKLLSISFKKFREKFPDRYDYKAAQIPDGNAPPSVKMSVSRARPLATRQRSAVNSSNHKTHTLSSEDNLSVREKCALAAEKRLLEEKKHLSGLASKSIQCNQCKADLSIQKKFTYMDFNFCSPGCLRAHRLAPR